jgi:N-acetylmuramoyl-L-alanine amidase
MNFSLPAISAALFAPKFGRLIMLTAGSALLLAAGSVSDSSFSTAGSSTFASRNDSMLAPMPATEAAAAQAALDATIPAHDAAAETSTPDAGTDAADAARPATLAALVASITDASEAVAEDRDVRCLATAVYFESRGEPLEGQLAVAQAILNRVVSGRYADNACAVISQPGQFSFNRSLSPRVGGAWETAKTIAMIASDGMWREIAPKAMSFHANYVAPNWVGKTKVVRIGRHIFYR